ncbi:hypothetical protein JCM11251_007979 [Rhodosporidiobolus azoricus]
MRPAAMTPPPRILSQCRPLGEKSGKLDEVVTGRSGQQIECRTAVIVQAMCDVLTMPGAVGASWRFPMALFIYDLVERRSAYPPVEIDRKGMSASDMEQLDSWFNDALMLFLDSVEYVWLDEENEEIEELPGVNTDEAWAFVPATKDYPTSPIIFFTQLKQHHYREVVDDPDIDDQTADYLLDVLDSHTAMTFLHALGQGLPRFLCSTSNHPPGLRASPDSLYETHISLIMGTVEGGQAFSQDASSCPPHVCQLVATKSSNKDSSDKEWFEARPDTIRSFVEALFFQRELVKVFEHAEPCSVTPAEAVKLEKGGIIDIMGYSFPDGVPTKHPFSSPAAALPPSPVKRTPSGGPSPPPSPPSTSSPNAAIKSFPRRQVNYLMNPTSQSSSRHRFKPQKASTFQDFLDAVEATKHLIPPDEARWSLKRPAIMACGCRYRDENGNVISLEEALEIIGRTKEEMLESRDSAWRWEEARRKKSDEEAKQEQKRG